MTPLKPPLGHRQEVVWTPVDGRPEPTWVSFTFRGSRDNARLELWTNAPVKDADEGWKAVAFCDDTAVVLCRPKVSFEYTYRAVHPDGAIEWLGNESCNGLVTCRRGEALPEISGSMESVVSSAQDRGLVGWQVSRSDDIFILYFDNPPFAVFHDLAPDVLPTNGAVLVNMPDLNSFVTTESRIGESLILKVDSHSGSLTVSSADGKDILTYRALQSKNAANGHATAQSSAGLDEDGKAEIAAPRKWRVPSNGSDLWIAFPDQAPELVEVVSAGKRRNVFLVLLFALRAWWQRLCAVWLGEEPAESATQDPEGSNATERTSLLNGNARSDTPYLAFPETHQAEGGPTTILIRGSVERIELEIRQDGDWQKVDIEQLDEQMHEMLICECSEDLAGSVVRIRSSGHEMSS